MSKKLVSIRHHATQTNVMSTMVRRLQTDAKWVDPIKPLAQSKIDTWNQDELSGRQFLINTGIGEVDQDERCDSFLRNDGSPPVTVDPSELNQVTRRLVNHAFCLFFGSWKL